MPDRLSWAEIRRLALRHKKALWLANLAAVLATLCSALGVPPDHENTTRDRPIGLAISAQPILPGFDRAVKNFRAAI